MKTALGVEYCGRDYYGWQRQDIHKTIQSEVEDALSYVANESVGIVCAGRTDAGVHAIQQVVHFETSVERVPHAWVFGGNTKLPSDIVITWAKPVAGDFHARFSALSRTYQYIIYNRRVRPGIHNGLVTWEYRALDLDRMRMAAKYLVGEHDFTSFRAVACQAKTPVRTVHYLHIHRLDNWFVLTICANAFLHHMVRNIAGVLILIGIGKKDPDWMQEILQARDRTVGGATAPPDGLYLANITYPKRYAIPQAKTLMEHMCLDL